MSYIKLDYVFIYWLERKKYKVMKQTTKNNKKNFTVSLSASKKAFMKINQYQNYIKFFFMSFSNFWLFYCLFTSIW